MKPTYEELERQLEESRREFRAADATIHNLELKITDMAVQLANSESKCRELEAELSAVDKIHNEAVFITDDHYEQCPPEVQKIIRSLAVLQIPAYKSFLAEVLAQGVDVSISELNQLAERSEKEAPIAAEHHRSAALYLQLFAAQLRQEAAK
ncbi:hypothetical protein [Citrobacter sp. BIDMC108]|uniref:hypothetical protein n=1 Tax=Citrobacter sp. BIDMC108 TaxID=1686385 RepID=UPI00065A707C|nr:hypothetical protein [Citrobacter sp. BIDMC108]